MRVVSVLGFRALGLFRIPASELGALPLAFWFRPPGP